MSAKTILALLFVLSLGVVAVCLLRVAPQQVAAIAARPPEVHEVLTAAARLERGTGRDLEDDGGAAGPGADH